MKYTIKTLLLAVSISMSMPLLAQQAEIQEHSCLTEPSDEINLSSQVSGVARKVYVERGDNVTRGQRLVRLNNNLEDIQFKLAKARHELISNKIKRNQELIDKQLLTSQEADELLTEQRIALLEKQQAQARLSERTIYSPVNGLISERRISPGEYVGSDYLFKLVVLEPLHVEVVLGTQYYGDIKPGDRLKVRFPGFSEQIYEGQVSIVDKNIDAASDTFGVRLVLQNKKAELPAGLKCDIERDE